MSRKGLGIRRGLMRECFAALALIALFARALIPVGYMPAVVHGHTQLALCEGGTAAPAQRGHHGHSGSQADAPCLYAMSGGAAPLPAKLDFSLAPARTVVRMSFVERTAIAEAPPRYTAPRGPPSLA
jgi:hypothetical protein